MSVKGGRGEAVSGMEMERRWLYRIGWWVFLKVCTKIMGREDISIYVGVMYRCRGNSCREEPGNQTLISDANQNILVVT